MKEPDVTKKVDENSKPSVNPKKIVEISPESAEERRLLTDFLLDDVEQLTKERNRRKEQFEEEPFELRGGTVVTRLGIKLFVQSLKRPYTAIFPNKNRFFKNMFRLHPHLMKHDYEKYEKPYLAGKLLKKLTYDRFSTDFSQEVLATLIVFAMPDGIRLFKCHEFLTKDGVKAITKFRNQANRMMDKYKDGQWYEFLKEFSEKYKKVFQPEIF
ncbi:MAG TPA: P63C domain-containing protein [Puia sp.]|nr:P63C domain-containing protein [Puia sp.]